MEIRRCGADPIDFELLFFKEIFPLFIVGKEKNSDIFFFLARDIKDININGCELFF